MTTYNTLLVNEDKHVATVWLNRPHVHNALNGEMIRELLHFFSEIMYNKEIRVVVIRGTGSSFCAGADLNWMKEAMQLDYEQNYMDSLTIAKCFYAIYACPKAVVSVVHGAVMGGGNGLVAVSDVAISAANTRFALGEVSLGLVPAVISPYIIKKMGKSHSRELMLLARSFNSTEAERYGLINYVTDENDIENKLEELLNRFLQNSPVAIQNTKLLMRKLDELREPEDWITYTSEVIAKARVSDEGQEGMAAFLKKQKPGWAAKVEKNN